MEDAPSFVNFHRFRYYLASPARMNYRHPKPFVRQSLAWKSAFAKNPKLQSEVFDELQSIYREYDSVHGTNLEVTRSRFKTA